MTGLRSRLGWWLRKWADRIDEDHAPRIMSFSFTFEEREGIRFRDDGRGCQLAYLDGRSNWDRAYDEADTEWLTPEEQDRKIEGMIAELEHRERERS